MIRPISYNDKIQRMYLEESKGFIACRNVTFVVTDDCCLRCTYCYETHKGHRYMTNDTAKKCVDLLFDMYDKDEKDAFINKDTKGLILEFIGGEPLMNIDVIDYTCNYFWNKALELRHVWADNFRISMISNGEYYFNDKVQNFIRRFKDRLSFGITIDGDKEMHDSCRVRPDGSGNWEVANKAQEHYHKNFDDRLSTKVTISPDNLQYLNNTVNYFLDIGSKEIFANPIYEHEWTLEEGREYYSKLKEIADCILEREEEIFFSIFREDCYKPQSEEELNCYCGGSGLMLSFDTNGDAYPCIRYMRTSLGDDREPIIIGNCDRGIYKTEEEKNLQKYMASINRRTQSNDECFYCPIGIGCGCCTAWCYQKFGTMDKRDNSICYMHKAASLVNVYYWNKYYKKNNIDKIFEMHLKKDDAIEIVGEKEYNLLLELVDKK